MRLKDWLLSGRPIMIFDSEEREGEVDLVYYAPAITEAAIYNLRTLAGGLICFAAPLELGERLGLRFMFDVVKEIYPALAKLPKYGDKPAFSLWVNHVDVRTGISDNDRAKTITALVDVFLKAKEDSASAREKFAREFYAPGHVPILLARKLEERRGHTELSVRLMESLGLEPLAVFAEMLDYGRSMSLDKASAISRALGVPLLKGEDVVGMTSDSNVER